MNSRSKKSSQKTRMVVRKQPTLSVCLTHPPPIQQYAIVHNQRLRFSTNAAFTGAITFQNLLDSINVATTAVAPYNLFDFVKVKMVELWSRPADGLVNTVSVIFGGFGVGALGDSITHTDTSMGIEPAHLMCRPSRKSQASQFQPSGTSTAMYLILPASAVIDVVLTFKGSTLGSAIPAQNASIGAPVGATFWRGLDGKAIATTVFLPPAGVEQF